jgi:hypothetical protein
VTASLLERSAQAVERSRLASVAARVGLVARAGFYLLLAYLVVRIALMQPGRQANASGALKTVSSAPGGWVPLVLTALGFLAFGVSRLLGAVRDRAANTGSRITTALQGLFYVGLTEVPASFVLGNRKTGSEQQERGTTAKLLGLPAGRVVLAAIGLVLVAVCVWQVVSALRTGFETSLRIDDKPGWFQRLVRVIGRIGISLRALVFLPVGVFLVVAAVRSDPRQAKGLDASLAALAHQSWGRAVLLLVATGLVVFVAYSVLEARYRDVDAGD